MKPHCSQKKISVKDLSTEESNAPANPAKPTTVPTKSPSPIQTQVHAKSKVPSTSSGILAKETNSSQSVPPPSDKAASFFEDANFRCELIQSYGVPIKGNLANTRHVYWSLPADQPDIGPAERAIIARRNTITLVSELKED